ncbi:MAG: lytic transglycosylase domain-containing protein [Rhodospirillales bacterium]|nr:lytic transglycosylase domain-containing protein [Rhodospirillales bacterium]
MMKTGIGRKLALLAVFVLVPVHNAGAGMTVPPIPTVKPLMINEAAAQGGVIIERALPLPPRKPDFGMPAVAQLLNFGKAPVPKKRPIPAKGAPLSPQDSQLYQKIFSAQTRGQWDTAGALMNRLSDQRLRGYVLFQRYMHPSAYSATFDELSGWMDMYADHPGADRIYKLALARMPADYKGALRKPVEARGGSFGGYLDIINDRDRPYKSKKSRTAAQRDQIIALSREIRRDLSRSAPTNAYKRLLEDPRGKLLDTVEYDRLQSLIARSYMLEGKLDKAMDIARVSALRSGTQAPQSGWVAGLVSWRQGEYAKAARYFEIMADSSYASPWTAAAGAYWASRAHLRAGNVKAVSPWLQKAAQNPRTFYGLIATRALGWDFDFNWDIPEFSDSYRKKLGGNPAAQRAMLLVAAGQYHLAESELRNVNIVGDQELRVALLAYAENTGLPAFSMRLAESYAPPSGGLYDAALYPLAPWTPKGGFKVDRALIHALIRQESRFNPAAENGGSGAVGLMQLMPATATHVARTHDFRTADGRHTLKDPQVNLDIGQRYVEELLYQDHVGTELFSLLVAYNAGPGNLRKWKRELAFMQDDPLLFIESIPVGETRVFVERVMSNYWIYRLRLKQDTPSLDAVAEGQWARYVQMDSQRFAAVQ